MSRRALASAVAALAICAVPAVVIAASVTVPHTFVAGRVASAREVNENFSALATAVNDNDARIAALQPGSLTPSQRDTLTQGGNADALHTHAGTGGSPRKLRVVQLYQTAVQTTVVNATGRGELRALRFETLRDTVLRVIVDGDPSPTSIVANGLGTGGSGTMYEVPLGGEPLVFASSLRIEVVPSGASPHAALVTVVYGIE